MSRLSALAVVIALMVAPGALAAGPPAAHEHVPGARLVARTPPAGGAWAFAQLAARFDATWLGGEGFSRFDLGRAELGAAWLATDPDVGAVVQLTLVRSAGPDSLLGVDGDALVAALSRAYAYYRVDLGEAGVVTASLGMLPHAWFASLEPSYDLRAIHPLAADGLDLLPRDDLGVQLAWASPGDRAGVRLAVMNGEGARQVELDANKDLDVVAYGAPWVIGWLGEQGRLLVALGLRRGTRGAGSVTDDRYLAALAFAHPRLGVGVEGVFARGFADRSDRDVYTVAAWSRAEPLPDRLGVYARWELARLDADVASSERSVLDVGVYTELAADAPPLGRLRLSLGYRAERFGAAAGAVAGAPEVSDNDTVLLRLEAIAATPL